MAKLKFYTDEHISKAVVKGLQMRGVDAISCIDANMRTATDLEHLKFAAKENRVLVSYDNDFLRIHNSGITHSGIAFSSRCQSTGELISVLLLMYEILSNEDMENQVEFI